MYITRVNHPVMNALTPNINIRTAAFNRKSFTQLLWTGDWNRVHTRTEKACQARCSHTAFLTHPRHPNTPGLYASDATRPCTHDDNFPRPNQTCRRSARAPLHAVRPTSFRAARRDLQLPPGASRPHGADRLRVFVEIHIFVRNALA